MRPIVEIERDVIVTYFEAHWNRTQLATFEDAPEVPDPGHGHDELSATTYFGHPFHPAKEADLQALSNFAVREMRGEAIWDLTMLDGPWNGQTLGLTSADGETFILQAPAGDEVVVPQADLEDGATVPFTSTPGNFSATVAAGWLHGAGFVTLNLTELGPGGPENRGHLDTGRRGHQEARVQLHVLIASPPEHSPKMSELYAGAAYAILQGVDFIRDAGAAPGTLEREMADAGLSSIRQLSSRDPAMARANHVGDENGWRWYLFQIIFRRVHRRTRAGRRPIQP